MGISRPLFIYFRPFHSTTNYRYSTKFDNEWKSVDGVLWFQTRHPKMVGIDESIELWLPLIPISVHFAKVNCYLWSVGIAEDRFGPA